LDNNRVVQAPSCPYKYPFTRKIGGRKEETEKKRMKRAKQKKYEKTKRKKKRKERREPICSAQRKRKTSRQSFSLPQPINIGTGPSAQAPTKKGFVWLLAGPTKGVFGRHTLMSFI
jgi:hypothetical protein